MHDVTMTSRAPSIENKLNYVFEGFQTARYNY